MALPTINFEHVIGLINSADKKIARFNQKVERIEIKILALKSELDMVTAMVEYISAQDKRAKLVEMFYESGEYGTAPKEDTSFLEIFEKRKSDIEGHIPLWENRAKQRKDHIEFMKNDLVLLEKIKGLNSLSRYRYAVYLDV